MSHNNLYLSSTQWNYWIAEDARDAVTIPGYGDYEGAKTTIVRISLNSGALKMEAEALIPGTMINQFAMDEYDGHLRVATTWEDYGANWWRQNSGLWILDSSLELVGSIPELVNDESIQSVRFSGEVAYVLTFKQVDPLFTIDVSDPANPVVQSELKIPGFSSYLHPFGEGLLLGIGTNLTMEGDSIEGEGLKLSMFDVSDPFNVTEYAVTGIYGKLTEVASDHKAAFVDVERGLFGFPVISWEYDANWMLSKVVWDYVLYSWDGTTFTEVARIDLLYGIPPKESYNVSMSAARGIRIGGDFYTVANGAVGVYTMEDYTPLTRVTLS
jgi:hypothetical protein